MRLSLRASSFSSFLIFCQNIIDGAACSAQPSFRELYLAIEVATPHFPTKMRNRWSHGNYHCGSHEANSKASILSPFLVFYVLVSVIQTESSQDGEKARFLRGQQSKEFCAKGTWQSTRVHYDSNGSLKYYTDGEGNRIPDFSHVGYKYGGSLPHVRTVHSIRPISGDNTQHIQEAIDLVGKLPKDEHGFRGALHLEPGVYLTDNPVTVPYDGVVVRGSGRGDDPVQDTIIFSTRTGKDEAVFIMGAKLSDTRWGAGQEGGSRVHILDEEIPIGERQFTVHSHTSTFKRGDIVVVQQAPKYPEWYGAVDEGGVQRDMPWSELHSDTYWTIRYLRFVDEVICSEMHCKISVDAPFYHKLDSALGELQIAKYDKYENEDSMIYHQVGIENLRIDIEAYGNTDEEHTVNGVIFWGVIGGFARDVSALHFRDSGFDVHRSSGITIENCFAGSPVSKITGGRRYNFNVSSGGQQVLFRKCISSEGRHSLAANGKTSSNGIVFVDCEIRKAIKCAEAHMHWTLGILYDGCSVSSKYRGPETINFGFCAYNRGGAGTSHGWAAANNVMWNIKTIDGLINPVQKPPTAQNYAIGVDRATGKGKKRAPKGYIEGSGMGSSLCPRSLYKAQLVQRETSTSISDEVFDVKPTKNHFLGVGPTKNDISH